MSALSALRNTGWKSIGSSSKPGPKVWRPGEVADAVGIAPTCWTSPAFRSRSK